MGVRRSRVHKKLTTAVQPEVFADLPLSLNARHSCYTFRKDLLQAVMKLVQYTPQSRRHETLVLGAPLILFIA